MQKYGEISPIKRHGTLGDEFDTGLPQDPDSLESVLLNDVVASMNSAKDTEQSVWRRNFVRAAFAAVEGFLWSVQQELLDTTRFKLSEAERGYLQGKATKLNDKGAVQEVVAKTTLAQQVRLVASLVKRVHPRCVVDLGGEGWSDLMDSLELRHRLTHPKLRSDLEISQEEFVRVGKGLSFFVLTIVGTLRKGLADYRTANAEQYRMELLVKMLRDYKSPNVPPAATPLRP